MTSDLNTLALQYVLGELSDSQTDAFESRLEADQSAREALADAVVLTAALRQMISGQAASGARPRVAGRAGLRRSRLAATALCAAACLMVVVAMRLPGGGRFDGIADETAIVGTWNELGADQVLLSDLDADVVRDDSPAGIPDWMVAAVLEDSEVVPGEEGTL